MSGAVGGIRPGKTTLALLEDIERRIDPEVEEDFKAQWRTFLYGGFEGEIFTPRRKKLSPPAVAFPSVHINDAIEDLDLMMQAQLVGVSASLNHPALSPCLRANYGTGILSSVFGAELFMMPRKAATLPSTRPCNDPNWMRAMVERGMPDLRGALGGQVFAFGEYCAELFSHYPKVRKYVIPYHPDLQGPLDLCELLWGTEIFYSMYDEPELVHAAMSLITDAYEAFMKEWQAMFPPEADMNPHWGSLYHRGTIHLRRRRGSFLRAGRPLYPRSLRAGGGLRHQYVPARVQRHGGHLPPHGGQGYSPAGLQPSPRRGGQGPRGELFGVDAFLLIKESYHV